jgi:hypothetical protein
MEINRYEKARIYRVIDNSNGQQYIGSTCKSLSNRLSQHKYDYQKYLEGIQHYISSFDILKNCDFSIILIEEYPCSNKEQLLKRERYYIETLNCINKRMPIRTKEERVEITKIQNYNYQKNNVEKVKEIQKNYYNINKDTINEKKRMYYKENKEKKTQRPKEQLTCMCGATHCRNGIARHQRTKKHQEYCKSLNTQIK